MSAITDKEDQFSDVGDSDATIPVDSELEDGEIKSDDEVNPVKTTRQKIVWSSPPSSTASYTTKLKNASPLSTDLRTRLPPTLALSNSRRSKRRQRHKKRLPINSPSTKKTYQWSDIRMLMVGDERVVSFKWDSWDDLPVQDIIKDPTGNISSMCALANEHLTAGYDVLVMVGFHDELASMDVTDNHGCSIIRTKDINMETMQYTYLRQVITKHNDMWRNKFPRTRVIWALPYPIDFYAYNSKVCKYKSGTAMSVFDQDRQTRHYYKLVEHLGKNLKKELPRYIQLFDLGQVLFFGKENYRSTFFENFTPKFPLGFLRCGYYVSEKMAVFSGLHLIDFMVKQEFFPGYTKGIDKSSLAYCHFESSTKKRLTNSSHRTNLIQISPQNDNIISISTDSSPEKEPKRNKRPFSKQSPIPLVLEESPLKKTRRSATPEMLVCKKGDEKFFEALNRLKRVHLESCQKYRSAPLSHPRYEDEKAKYLSQISKNSDKSVSLARFPAYWEKRMEELMAQSWSQTQIDLTVAFSRQEPNNKDEIKVPVVSSMDSSIEEISPVDVTSSPSTAKVTSSYPTNPILLPPIPDSTVTIDEDNSNSEINKSDIVEKPVQSELIAAGVCDMEIDNSESSVNNDDDCQFDELLEDENFLADLDDIAEDIRSAMEDEKSKDVEDPIPSVESSDFRLEFIYLMRMLSRLTSKLGPISETFKRFHTQEFTSNSKTNLEDLINNDVKFGLKVAQSRLEELLKDHPTEVQKYIYSELCSRIDGFFKKLDLLVFKFPKVSIKNIVQATVGKDVPFTIDFIRNTLIYLGYSNFSNMDVTQIFVSVNKYSVNSL